MESGGFVIDRDGILMKKFFLIFLISFVFAAIVGELYLRIFQPQITFSKAVASSIDCYRKDPDIPFTLGRSYTCQMKSVIGEFNVKAHLNSLGYRGKEFPIEKNKGTTRILTLGDSMTFGWGVGDEVTYPALLEKFLNISGKANTEVINAGYVGGLSPDTYYIYLKNQGMKLKPDVIIVNIFPWNDITDFAENIWVKENKEGLPEKIEDCCHMVDGRIFRNRVINFKYRFPFLRESYLFIFFSDFAENNLHLIKETEQLTTKGEAMMGCVLNPDCIHLFYPEEEKMYTMLSAMKKLADENGSKFLVILLPVDVQLYPESQSKYSRYAMKWYLQKGNENFLGNRISKTLTERGIATIDLYPDFNQEKSRGYPFFPIDAHFNPIGTQIAAESIGKYLLENTFLP